jgi:hypothetical protein
MRLTRKKDYDMKKSMIVFCLVFLGMVTMATNRTSATVLLEKDFQDLAKEADLIFAGTVTDVNSEWDGEAYHSEIYTYVTFSDLEIIAGEYKDVHIDVRFSGGVVNGAGITYTGVPTFNLGERNLIFLTGNFVKLCPIVGWGQGLLKIIEDQETGEEVLFSRDGRLVTEIKNNKFVLNGNVAKITGSPGIPDAKYINQGNSKQSLKHNSMKITADKKLSLKDIAKATRVKRAKLKEEGAKLGYNPISSPIEIKTWKPTIE